MNHIKDMKSNRASPIWRLAGAVILGIFLILAVTDPSKADTKAVARVAVLTPGMAFDPLFQGFQEGLGRLGYKEGRNVEFIVEDTKGSSSDLAPRLARLLATKPDILYAVGTLHAIAAKQATSAVPVLFAWVGDPLQAKLIAAYSSSQNNLTGIVTSSDSLSGKRLESLILVAPKIKRLLAIVSPKEYVAQSSFRFLEETAKKLNVQVVRRDATTEEELRRVLHDTPKGSVDALYHIPSYLGSFISLLIEKAKQDKIPLVVHEESMAVKGALLSYGPDFRSAGAQSSRLAVKLLKGEKPADIPSETPEKLFLVVNVNTAKAIGLKVPRAVLERADRLVE
jgi:putative tryptophan/tyrosine transport system substrate-binding protein